MFDQVRLNEIMTHLSARKQYGGTFYISHGLNRYLQGPQFNKKKIDIIKDADFRDAKVSFRAALDELNMIGKGYVEHHSVINESDRWKLYDSKHMSPDTPCGIQNKVQFDIRLYFCRRSVENVHSMSRSLFQVKEHPS